ncbi:MAG: transglutaminase domain-containing protein [Flavitalea sp.]
MLRFNHILKFYLAVYIVSFSCNRSADKISIVLQHAGKKRPELEKVIAHFKQSSDPLKLKAAYYLIENLPAQYHYEGKTVDEFERLFTSIDSAVSAGQDFDLSHTGDSLTNKIATIDPTLLKKVSDLDEITADFLIKNIEEAFEAWQYPWARNLSFEEFCELILPYKVKDEKAGNWRSYFREKYKWVLDSVKDKNNSLEACLLINNDLKKWFYFTKIDFPFDPSFDDLLKLRSGRCPEQIQITTYAMRAMGIPVTYDYVTSWANRNNAHDWNGLLYQDKVIPFIGTESDPGIYKIEFSAPGAVKSKRAKVFRRTYATVPTDLEKKFTLQEIPPMFRENRFSDVTKQYIPVSDIALSINPEYSDFGVAYLCVFNNLTWKPVQWSFVRNETVSFTGMGRGIIYLPVVYEENDYTPCGMPFVLKKDGSMSHIKANPAKRTSITIDRKYPVGDDNKIEKGNNYELFYWDNNKWISLGRQQAMEEFLIYRNIPEGALCWLRDLDKGLQERIFTIENNKIVWW